MIQAQVCGSNRKIEILNQDVQLMVTSRQISEDFGKEHSSVVIRSIENLIKELKGSGQNCTHLFILGEYTHEQNKQIYIEYVRWDRVNEYLSSFATYGEIKKGDLIPELAVYVLEMKANNYKAIKLQTWLAADVLPTIRKDGMYAKDELLDSSDLLIEVASKLKEEKQARLEAEKKVVELKPKLDSSNF